jgi:Calponin homology (CH) domain
MVNKVKPGMIDERKLTKRPPNTFELRQNLSLAIQGCRELGLKVVNIGAEDLIEGKVSIPLSLLFVFLLREQSDV